MAPSTMVEVVACSTPILGTLVACLAGLRRTIRTINRDAFLIDLIYYNTH